jgi:hypothetical protein
MLSIRFADGREWWTSGENFERLYHAALSRGTLAPELDEWRHVADANGGLSLDALEPQVASQLASGLAQAAERELATLAQEDADEADASYRESLIRLVGLSP